MKITSIKINKYENKNTKGFASVTFDDLLCVTGITIIEGKNGLFVSMPQAKNKDGEYHDIVFPITKEGRKAINDKIIEEYKKVAEIPFS